MKIKEIKNRLSTLLRWQKEILEIILCASMGILMESLIVSKKWIWRIMRYRGHAKYGSRLSWNILMQTNRICELLPPTFSNVRQRILCWNFASARCCLLTKGAYSYIAGVVIQVFCQAGYEQLWHHKKSWKMSGQKDYNLIHRSTGWCIAGGETRICRSRHRTGRTEWDNWNLSGARIYDDRGYNRRFPAWNEMFTSGAERKILWCELWTLIILSRRRALIWKWRSDVLLVRLAIYFWFYVIFSQQMHALHVWMQQNPVALSNGILPR